MGVFIKLDREKVSIGVDIGGTKIALGLVSNSKILDRETFPTEAEKGYRPVVDRLVLKIRRLIERNGICRKDIGTIGIGVPGTVNLHTGDVILAPNINWRNVPLVSELRDAFPGVFICADKDTNITAWGEFLQCKDQSVNNLYFITISTGIGSGMVINRQLYRGGCHMSGEIGHIVVENNGLPCGCGNMGCLQEYARGPAIVREAERRVRCGESSILYGILARDGKLDNVQIGKAAIQGDELACSVLFNAAQYIGRAIGSVINIMNPEVIILGGGVIRLGEVFLNPIKNAALNSCFPPSKDKVRIEATVLWEDAAIIGASFMRDTMP